MSPFITRWELENGSWKPKSGFPNLGARRDIPKDAVIHDSLKERLLTDKKYWPQNNHGGKEKPCLKRKGAETEFFKEEPRGHLKEIAVDPFHQTWALQDPSRPVNGA